MHAARFIHTAGTPAYPLRRLYESDILAGKIRQTVGEKFANYTEAKRSQNAVDYDDLLGLLAHLLQHPTIGDQLRKWFKFVLIDEFQDTNRLQFRIVRRQDRASRAATILEQNQRFSIKIIHVCARLFTGYLPDNTAGMENRRKPANRPRRTGPRFVRHAAIGLEADSAKIGHFGSEWNEQVQRGRSVDVRCSR
jgi:hypothetical protein